MGRVNQLQCGVENRTADKQQNNNTYIYIGINDFVLLMLTGAKHVLDKFVQARNKKTGVCM